LKDPQAVPPQVAVQTTPAPVGSFVTWAATGAVELTLSEAGGAMVSSTAIESGVTVSVTLLLCEGLLVTVAVMTIAVPIGTTEGAV